MRIFLKTVVLLIYVVAGPGCNGGDTGSTSAGAGEEGGASSGEGGGIPDANGELLDGEPTSENQVVDGQERVGAGDVVLEEERSWSTTPNLIVSEIMYNPMTVSDPVGEWFEVANTGKVSIPLGDLVIVTGAGMGSVLSGATLLPGGSAVLARSDVPSAIPEALIPDGIVSKMILYNDGGFIDVLLDGELLDSAQYQPGLGTPPVIGASISLDPTAYDRYENNNPFAWCVSSSPYAPGELGSPGVANPPCPIPPVLGEWSGEEGGSEETGGEGEGSEGGGEGSSGGLGEIDALVITELMFDPTVVNDSGGEWLEIVNTSSGKVDLRGVTLTDDNNEHLFYGDEPLWIHAGELVVLARSSDSEANGGLGAVYTYQSLGLNNSGDTVSLWSGDTLIDAVTYGSDFPMFPGYSLSLRPAAWDASSNDDPSNWCPSDQVYGDGDWGSPGWENSVCPEGGWLPTPSGDVSMLVITEIMYDPDASKDPAGEWFEIQNTGTETVDINGIILEEGGASHQIVSGTPLLIGAGEFAVLARSGVASKNGGLPNPLYIYKSLSLNNSGDLVLLRNGDTELDRVEYSAANGFPTVTGASIQLSPLIWATPNLNDSGIGWCPSPNPFGDGDLGSPGEENPSCE